MKRFKDYEGSRNSQNMQDMESEGLNAEELTKKIASAYNGKSNADMMRSILAEAERSKRAGTLSNEEIENFYQTFSPMLNGTQRKQLRAVVERLKKI